MSATTSSANSLFRRRAALAPVCLLLVAALHLFRVATTEQSAWKGGGFGMFSTVDAPPARFIRAYAVTPSGKRPIALPQRLEKMASELRTAPSQAGVDELAEKLAAQSYIDERRRWQQIGERLAARDAGAAPASAALLRNHRALEPATNASWPPGDNMLLTPVGSVDQRRERGDIVPVERVEIELWRYRYDRAMQQVVAELLFAAQRQSE